MTQFEITLPADHEALQLLEASKNIEYGELVQQYVRFCHERQLDLERGEQASKERRIERLEQKFFALRSIKNSKKFLNEFHYVHYDVEVLIKYIFAELSDSDILSIKSIVDELANASEYVRFTMEKREFEAMNGTQYVSLTITRKKRKIDFVQARQTMYSILDTLARLHEYSMHLLSIFDKIKESLTESSTGDDIVPFTNTILSMCSTMKPLLIEVDKATSSLNFEHVSDHLEEFFTEKNALSRFKESCKEYLKQNTHYSNVQFDIDDVEQKIAEQFESFAHFNDDCHKCVRSLLEKLQEECKSMPNDVIQPRYSNNITMIVESYNESNPSSELHQWIMNVPYVIMGFVKVRLNVKVEKNKNTILFKYHAVDYDYWNGKRDYTPWYKGENLVLSPEYKAFYAEFEKSNTELLESMDPRSFTLEAIEQFCIENGIPGHEKVKTASLFLELPSAVASELLSLEGIITVEI